MRVKSLIPDMLGGRKGYEEYLTLLILLGTITSVRNTGYKQLEELPILAHAAVVRERTPSSRDRVDRAFALNPIDYCQRGSAVDSLGAGMNQQSNPEIR